MNKQIIKKITGTALPLKGDDIDTDRIMPARYLKELTFDNLGEYVFYDEKIANPNHPFNQPRYRQAKFLIVNSNFGCGSSREHAPQGIKRFGIDCIIGESYSEIFFANCCSIGLPCLKVDSKTATALQELSIENPEIKFALDLESNILIADNQQFQYNIDKGIRESFVQGSWDITAELLSHKEQIISLHKKLQSM